MTAMTDRLNTLVVLQPGWLDGTGHRPTAAALGLAALLAEPLATTATGPLHAYPTEDGGVELEWHQDQLTHSARIGPHGQLHLLTLDPADADDPPQHGHHQAAAALRTEAAAMDRLTEQVAWPVLPHPEPQVDSATLRAVAALLDTLEAE
ncbi:hypothetical protein ACIGZJ_30815 [Kitasatospora sp. NPDC052868]|uniref:hypothetical protein n=1 Tax=Kitasatospora sp. NPDC052868 TaxID=3364060 RepID=UPI0037C981D4